MVEVVVVVIVVVGGGGRDNSGRVVGVGVVVVDGGFRGCLCQVRKIQFPQPFM
jgi:hypothetical protein